MSLSCVRFVNSLFTSNAYIISYENKSDIWVVDPGDTLPIYQWMAENGKTEIKGILLTHSHFDHIYGINDIISRYPQSVIYVANESGKHALFDAKLNGSKYTERAIIISECAKVCYYPSQFYLWYNIPISVYMTPGHSDDSVCFTISHHLFTGDTLIKDTRTVTKLKNGSVEKLKQSLKLIKSIDIEPCIILPGHGEEFFLRGYDFNKALYNKLRNN